MYNWSKIPLKLEKPAALIGGFWSSPVTGEFSIHEKRVPISACSISFVVKLVQRRGRATLSSTDNFLITYKTFL